MGKTEEIPVIWFQAAGCTGCAISVMNAEYPDIGNLLLDELVPGKGLAFRFQATLMGPTGLGTICAGYPHGSRHIDLTTEGKNDTGMPGNCDAGLQMN